jgi:RNA polymerase sigma factor (sigma-70 family)
MFHPFKRNQKKKALDKLSQELPLQTNDDNTYRQLIVDNLHYIEKQCYKAYGIYKSSEVTSEAQSVHDDSIKENKADFLFVQVIDHLKADNYKVLRDYEGGATLKRYLTVIISRKVVDIFRSQEGRCRAKDKAKQWGDLGLKLYDLVFVKGYDVSEAHKTLKDTYGITESVEKIENIAEEIKRVKKEPLREISQGALVEQEQLHTSKQRVLRDDTGDITVPDSTRNPEQVLMEKDRARRKAEFLKEIISEMNPEERLMIKMRFQDNIKVQNIAKMLGMKEKTVSNRISRILTKCRTRILKKGLSLDDLI